MTRSEVESAIGQPAGDYSDPRFRASKSYVVKARESGIPFEVHSGYPKWEIWTWDDHEIKVAFDKDGKAVGYSLIESSREPPGFFGQLRNRLPGPTNIVSPPPDLPDDLSKPTYAGQSLAYWRVELKQIQGGDYIKHDIPLGRNGDPEAIPVLLELLKDSDDQIRHKAATCLGWLGPKAKSAVPQLTEALSDPEVKVAAAGALGQIGNDAIGAKPALLRAAEDKDFLVRFCVTKALWHITQDANLVVPQLQALLNDRDRYIEKWWRCSVAELLGEIGPPARKAIPDLIRYVEDDSDHCPARMYGAQALGRMGPVAEKAIPKLQAGLKDPDIPARVAAAVALWRVTERNADECVEVVREALREALKGTSATAKEDAVEALGEFGPKAKAAIPDLLGVLALPEDYPPTPSHKRNKHTLAREALMKIDPEALKKQQENSSKPAKD
jgi:HEAT repeat protein